MENCSVRVHTRAVARETSRSQRISRRVEDTPPSRSGRRLRFSLAVGGRSPSADRPTNYTLQFDYRVLYCAHVFTIRHHESISSENLLDFSARYWTHFHIVDNNIKAVEKKEKQTLECNYITVGVSRRSERLTFWGEFGPIYLSYKYY